MYQLKRKTIVAQAKPETVEAVRRASVLLRDSTSDLVFDPVPHEYKVGGRAVPSVSSVIEKYANFDAPATAASCSRNPKSPYYGQKVEDILKGWEDNANAASSAGSAVHAFGEACFLWTNGREEEIDKEFVGRISADGFAAESPKEIAVARWWENLDTERYAPAIKETPLFNPELNYAGTPDLLLYDTVDGCFRMKDYKTNKDLHDWYGKFMKGSFNKVIKDNDYGHYTVQQILYWIELLNLGLNVKSADLIWLKEDGNYEEVSIDYRYASLIYNTIKRDNALKN